MTVTVTVTVTMARTHDYRAVCSNLTVYDHDHDGGCVAVGMNDSVRLEVDALPFVHEVALIRPADKISATIYGKLERGEYGNQETPTL